MTELSERKALPVYVSNASPEQRRLKKAWVQHQLESLDEQNDRGVPVKYVKLRCGCSKLRPIHELYRCLYCDAWFCVECAEIHFGKRRD